MKTQRIEEYEKFLDSLLSTEVPNPYYQLKSYKLGIDFPPLILAEVVDAPKLTIEKITKRIRLTNVNLNRNTIEPNINPTRKEVLMMIHTIC